MPRLESENSVTNQSYWNSVWSGRSTTSDVLGARNFYSGRNGLFLKLVQSQVGNIRGRSIVEFGGGGNNVRLLAMAKWRAAQVTAVDFSEDGLRVLSDLFDANGCTLRQISADLTNWTPQERFDVVTHWGVLEHFVDPRPLLETSVSALKPGGALLFSMPNMEALAAGLWKRWSPENWDKHVLHSQRVVVDILCDLGLQDVRAFHFGIPFLKGEAWERKSLAQLPVDVLQKIGSATARVVPVFHRWGHRRVSMERGFFARRAP